jgi:hypothetical protein
MAGDNAGILLRGLKKEDIIFTTVPSGEIKFVVRGETLKKVLVNVPGYRLQGDEIVPGDANQPLLARWLGVYWIGWWPIDHIYTFTVAWEHWKDKEKKDEIVPAQDSFTSYHFMHTYPIDALALELESTILVDIRISLIVRVVKPVIPIFLLKGLWFDQFKAAVIGAISDYANNLEYEKFLEDDRNDPAKTFIQGILALNPQLANTLGLQIQTVNYLGFEIPEKGQTGVIEAIRAAKLAEEQGKGLIATATAKAEAAVQDGRAIEAIGKAKAAALIEQVIATDGHPELLGALAQAEAIGNFKGGGALVINSATGGNPPGLVVPIGNGPPKP